MRRREFIGLIGGAAATLIPAAAIVPSRDAAAQSTKRALIGILFGGSRANSELNINSFLSGMRQHGYIDEKDVDLVYRFADGDTARQPTLAAELVRLKPDVIVTANTGAAKAVTQLSTTPVVSAALDDPIGSGLAESYARPGGQVTGVLFTIDTLPAKQLQIALEIVPGAKRAGVLLNPQAASWSYYRTAAERAADAMKAMFLPIEVRSPPELGQALAGMASAKLDVLLVLPNPLFSTEGPKIAAAAAQLKLPAVSAYRPFPSQGGLLSYGIDIRDNHRRAASMVDKILRGEKPANIPIELPTKFEMVVNLRLARSLGLNVPTAILLRADEVIE